MDIRINKYAASQIERIKEKCEKFRPLLVIRCITYNHELYIRDALEGFLMQETDFPFVVIIHDDASTDGTAKLIREYEEKYPDIIMPIYEHENQYSKRNGTLGAIINTACKKTGAKYMALCEGDDYWTDPLKLQKQVDFLETHPEYGMGYTKVERLNQITGQMIDKWGGPNETFESLYVKNTIPTLTVLLRCSLYSDYISEIDPANKNWKMGDYPLWLYIAAKGKIKFMDEVTGIYRVLPESASHSKSLERTFSFRTNFYKIGEEMANLLNYSIPTEVIVAQKREKFFHILPLALLLNDNVFIREAEVFYDSNKKSPRDFLLLKWKRLMRIILTLRYRKRGYRINRH